MMRLNLVIIAVLSTLILTSCSGSARPELKTVKPVPAAKRLLIAAGDFQNQSGNASYDPLMDGLTGNFISELFSTECFRIVERERLKSILDEHKLGMTGLLDPDKTKEIGKLPGVDAIVFVNLSSVIYRVEKKEAGMAITEKETFEINLDARLISIETGEILAAAKTSIPFENEFSSLGTLKKGEKIDPKIFVKKGLEDSAKILAHELAYQISKNQ